jgi:hypothetical protein
MHFIPYDNFYDKQIDELCKEHEFVNHRDNLVAGGIILENDRILAYGAVRKIYEGVIALDQKLTRKGRKEALQLLFDHGMMNCTKMGIDEWHVFVEDPIFRKILINSYGFKECKGNGLVFQFGE